MNRTSLTTKAELPHACVLDAVAIHRPGARPDGLTGGTAIAFAALVAGRDLGVSRAQLAELYWPDSRPSHWEGLVSFYTRWLQQRLPTGWQISEDDGVFRLCVSHGWIDAWKLADRFDTQLTDHEIEELRGTPYRGLPIRGILATSAERLHRHQELLLRRGENTQLPLSKSVGPSTPTGHCRVHRNAAEDLSDMTNNDSVSLVSQLSQATSDSLARWRAALEANPSQHNYIVDGGSGAGAAFADLAIAFTQIRWNLLEIQGRSESARVAKAWRLLQDHLRADTSGTGLRIVIFQAHRLDTESLEVVRQLARFPIAENACLVICGDPHDTDSRWQQLLCHLDQEQCPWFEPCLDCDPILGPIRRLPRNTRL